MPNGHLDALVVSELGAIRRTGRRYLHALDDLEDFVQEVIVRIYASRDTVRSPDAMASWMRGVARNTALQWNAKRRAIPVGELECVLSPSTLPDASVETSERWQALIDALNALNPVDRDLLRSYYADDTPYPELQERHGLSYAAARFRVHRAKRRVRSRLQTIFGPLAALFAIRTWSLPMRILDVSRRSALVIGAALAIALVATTIGLWIGPRPVTLSPDGRETGPGVPVVSRAGRPMDAAGGNANRVVNDAVRAREAQPISTARSEGSDRQRPSIDANDLPTPESEAATREVTRKTVANVIDRRLSRGYSTGDVDLYASAFWADSYSYHADLGNSDPSDDIQHTGLEVELASARGVFGRFDEHTISFAVGSTRFVDPSTVEATAPYEFTMASMGEVAGSGSGVAVFTFEKRGSEWRIARMEDHGSPAASE